MAFKGAVAKAKHVPSLQPLAVPEVVLRGANLPALRRWAAHPDVQ